MVGTIISKIIAHARPACLRSVAAFVVLIATGLASRGFAQVTVKEVLVTDETGRGVLSDVVELTGKAGPDGRITIDQTDPNGKWSPTNYVCEKFHHLMAHPKTGPYTDSPQASCQRETKLTVQRRDTAEALRDQARSALADEKYGVAALLYNEVYVRAAKTDPNLSDTARLQTIVNATRALGIKDATTVDPKTEKVLLSPNAVTNIKLFQKEKGLAETGQIDYSTLSKISNTSIYTYIKKAYNPL